MRDPVLKVPELGKTISIAPIAINFKGEPTVSKKTPGLKLEIMWGGRALQSAKGDPTLRFYSNHKHDEPSHTFSWQELESAYKNTGCTNDMIGTLDGVLMGVALICDGSVSLDGVTRIDAIDSKGEVRAATSWSTYLTSDDVTAVSIGLY